MKLPFISRSRHEREISLLKQGYSSSTSDLREKLMELISHFLHIRTMRDHENFRIRVEYVISEMEDKFMSPYAKDELYWHVSKSICDSIKREIQLHSFDELKSSPTPKRREKNER